MSTYLFESSEVFLKDQFITLFFQGKKSFLRGASLICLQGRSSACGNSMFLNSRENLNISQLLIFTKG